MRKIFVAGHRRADGKYVKPHWRTVPGAEPRATTMPAFAPTAHAEEAGERPLHLAPIPLTNSAQAVIGSLQAIGTPYIVGGSVRDSVLGLGEPKDVDIEMHGDISMAHMAHHLRSDGFAVDEVGKAFGVLKVVCGGEDFDVSLPRRDSLPANNSGRHTDIIATTDGTMGVAEASRRRDFTINAVMFDPATGEFVDPHGGLDDMRYGVLRAVDKASFAEDPLRVLRGVQFAGRLDMELDSTTESLCRSLSADGLAKERIAGELHKLVTKSTNFDRGVNTLHNVGWGHIAPSLTGNGNVNQQALNQLTCHPDPNVAMGTATAYISACYGEDKAHMARDLMLSKAERRHANWFTATPTNQAEYSRMLRSAYNAQVDYNTVDQAIVAASSTPHKRLWEGEPPNYLVDGNKLRELGYRPGREFKHIITWAHAQQDAGVKLTQADVVRYASELYMSGN